MLEYFQSRISALQSKILPASDALEAEDPGALGTTAGGYSYLKMKKATLMSTVLLAANYFVMLLDPSVTRREVDNHPILKRLNEVEAVGGRLEEVEEREGLMGQIEKVLEAVELMREGGGGAGDEEGEGEGDEDDGVEHDDDNEDDEEEDDEEEEEKALALDTIAGPESDSDDEDDVMDDSLFDDDEAVGARRKAPRADAPPSKRAKTSAKEKEEEEEKDDDDDEKVKSALALMEKDLATYDDGLGDGDFDDDDGDDEDDEGFDETKLKLPSSEAADSLYLSASNKSKARKQAKKDMYAVAPKFPRGEALVDGERSAGYKIMKNRGLVAHKAKINRNPRVKKREQFRKAVIRRKGAVRDIRTGEAEGYAGEETGVKKGISRSRKIKS